MARVLYLYFCECTQIDLEIGSVNHEGLRGTVAVRDMNKSQIAVHLPAHLAVELGEGHVTSEVKKSPHH